MIYEGSFDSAEDVFSSFEVPAEEQKDVKILYASYENENYEGSASVVFVKYGKFYEVGGSHCSCYGLEGQWDPTEVSLASMRHLHAKGATPYGMNYGPILAVVDDIIEGAETLSDDQLAMMVRLVMG